MRRLAVAVVAATAVLAMSVGSASAHVGPFVPPHQHVLSNPGTILTESFLTIGPDGCATGGVGAFQNFHYNIHVGEPGTGAFPNDNNPVSIRPAGCP
jgi:hypothetical protein